MDFRKLSIAIATHNRPEYLQRCADQWAATAPDYRQMFAIVNHPDGGQNFVPPPRCLVLYTGRIPEHAGNMAKTWNLAMQWAFRDADTEWLLCSMDDAEVREGWPTPVLAHDFDLYLAPAGDLVFLMNRRVLREVGWFDERFPLVAFQEWDWQARAIRGLGLDRVSLSDAHGWFHNGIGLEGFWIHLGNGAAPTSCDRRFDGAAVQWLQEKWGMGFHEFANVLRAGSPPEPKVPEIDWYPWFPR